MVVKMVLRHIFAGAVLLLLAFQPARADVPGAASPALPGVPSGQTEVDTTPIGPEVFGIPGGYFHPFLFLEGKYTDNLYYTRRNTQEDFITSISPGLWIAVPPNREKLLTIQTAPTYAGGLRISRMRPDAIRRMQGFLLYTPSFVFYANESDNDHVAHRAEGLFQYNFDRGHSIELLNQFNKRYEINNNAFERIDKYYDNMASLVLTLQPSDKLVFRADYAHYWLDYDDPANEFRDRMDNAISAYLFYRFLPKTAAFFQYEFVDIDYDTQDLFDSQEHRYYIGLDWDATADSRGRVKAGYIRKRFDAAEFGDEEGFSAELQMQHNFNPKRAGTLTAYHRYTETSISASYAVLTTGANLALMQRIDQKWSGSLAVLYYRDEFKGEFTLGGVTRERKDDTFRIGPTITFEPRDWMRVNLSYYYSERDSNFNAFDFENHTAALSIELSL